MKANEFVKKFGWKEAENLLCRLLELGVSDDMKFTATNNMWHRGVDGFTWSDLKRLVESHEVVNIHGYEQSKEIVANAPSDDHFYSWVLGESGVHDKTVNIGELRKALVDVEACQ